MDTRPKVPGVTEIAQQKNALELLAGVIRSGAEADMGLAERTRLVYVLRKAIADYTTLELIRSVVKL